MKYRNKVKKLQARIKAFEAMKDTKGYTKPGSVRK